MNFEAALAQELDTITDLGHRIYPLSSPETPYDLTKSYCIYVSSEGIRDKEVSDGYLSSRSVHAEINVIAPRYGDVKSVSASVIDLLIGFEQRQIGTDGPFIQEINYQMPMEFYEEAPKLYRCLIEFDVYY